MGLSRFPGRWNALDRRAIYLLVLIAVSVPLVWRITFRERPSPMVRDIFAAIDALPPGARVLLVPGLVMGVGQLLGARVGARMVVARGTRFIRPVFLTMVLAITGKMLYESFKK